jgi:four helix bundle protein
MDKYRSLVAWQRAHALVLLVLRTVDARYHPRSRALFDQLKRAVISIEANIVEGYALSTKRRCSSCWTV